MNRNQLEGWLEPQEKVVIGQPTHAAMRFKWRKGALRLRFLLYSDTFHP